MNIADKIYKIRENNNLSQEQLANKLNITRQAVSKWETHQSTPDYEKLTIISKIFNIEIKSLLDDNSEIEYIEEFTSKKDKMEKVVRLLSLFSKIMSLMFLIILIVIIVIQKNLSNIFGVSASFYFPITLFIFVLVKVLLNIIFNTLLIKKNNILINGIVYLISLLILYSIEKVVNYFTLSKLSIDSLTALSVVNYCINQFVIIYLISIVLFLISSLIKHIKNNYIY